MGIQIRRERGGMFKRKQEYEKLLEEYIEDEVLKGISKTSIKALRYRLRKLFEFIRKTGIELEEVGIKTAREYKGWLVRKKRQGKKKYTTGTINNMIKTAAGFYNYLKTKRLVCTNPFVEIKRLREGLRLPKDILREKEMNALLENLSNFDIQDDIKVLRVNYKMHVIAELMYATALRASEAAELKEEDIDFNQSVIHVKKGKGNRERIVFMSEYAKEIMRIYIERMRELVFTGNSSKETIFGMKGTRLLTQLNKVLKKACKKAGVNRITSHGFRHAFGYHFLRAGCDIRYIQELLGHREIKNTEIYTKVDKEDLKEVLDTYHPRKMRRIREDE